MDGLPLGGHVRKLCPFQGLGLLLTYVRLFSHYQPSLVDVYVLVYVTECCGYPEVDAKQVSLLELDRPTVKILKISKQGSSVTLISHFPLISHLSLYL